MKRTNLTLPPGLYRWPTGRVYDAAELCVVEVAGRLMVVPLAVWEAGL